jgi:hypothetical protein
VVCALIALVVLVGGLTRVGSQSGRYDASINRSFVAQGAVLAASSNTTGTSLRHLMEKVPQQDRQTLEADLDDVVAQATGQATRAAGIAISRAGSQGQFVTVFADREKAVVDVRAALDGLLGLHPLPVAGAPGTAGGSASATPALLSASQATDRIAAAGRLLREADVTYQQVRGAMARMPGHARLPASQWVTGGNLWQIGSVATQMDLVEASGSLAATQQLALSVVAITPPALPSPTGVATPTVSLLSPTRRVTLDVVVSNAGSVDEPHASIKFTLAAPTGAATTANRTISVASGRSVSLSPVSFSVKPGSSYQLTVAIVVPPGQTNAANTAVSETIQIAPST